MKKLLLLALLCTSGYVRAQDSIPKDTSYWKKGGLFSLSVTQVALQNWAAGGQNSVAVNSIINLFANYKRNNTTWDNNLDLGYGLINQGKMPWWDKSDDKIDLSSKLGQYAFKKHWYYSALLNFKSQFGIGYNLPGIPLADRTKISDFMAPAYVVLALGLDYKPNDDLSLFIAPFTGKFTIVNNQTLADQGAFGVEKAQLDASGMPIPGTGKLLRTEFGGYVKFMYKKNIMENISFTTKLDLFSNYLDRPQNIDVNWEVLIAMKINRFISATLNTVMIYDNDINIARDPDANGVPTRNGPIVQFKEVFSLGFNYKF